MCTNVTVEQMVKDLLNKRQLLFTYDTMVVLLHLQSFFSMQHRARKRFGQNFLVDETVIEQIIQSIRPMMGDNLIEIGPGKGALTFPLCKALQQMTVIELDRDLVVMLKAKQAKLTIVDADVLTVDFTALGANQRVVGNLPYNISTPIIMHLLQFRSWIDDMHFMLQKEVVERLAASPGSKAYGRLSVVVQYFCEVERLFDVQPQSFKPAPKVQSAIVRLRPYAQSPYDETCFESLQNIVKQAFSSRRKTLKNNLKNILNAEDFNALSISPSKRAEQLTVEEFVRMSNYRLKAEKR